MFTRRQVLTSLIAGLNSLIGAALAVPVVGYLLTPLVRGSGSDAWVSLGPVADYAGTDPRPVGFRYESQAGYTAETVSGFAYVVPAEGATPLVLSPVCTHMGCNVAWDGERRRFLCPCHGGQYTVGGRNVAGPPPRPLDRLPARIENGLLMVRAEQAT